MKKGYWFEKVERCEMCGDDAASHKVIGQRLDKSQGSRPRGKKGIAVSVVQCRVCKLVYPQPLPIPFDIQDHYGIPPESYWKGTQFEYKPEYFSRQIRHAKQLLPYRDGMAALDIGAGLGKCMISLQRAGFDAHGIEASVPFHERAVSTMGIDPQKLSLSALEEATFADGSFDFITFGAVLEHLYHPAQAIEKALGWLRPGGIVHIEVPSSAHAVQKLVNFYFRAMGTLYVTNLSPMHAPYHLYEFGLKSFQLLGQRLGFEIATHYFDVCTIYGIPKLLHPPLRKYMEKTDTGMQLTVYLRKTG